jgi:glutathione S-transferase
MGEFTLYAFKGRSRAERVLWTLRELDIAHELVRLNFAAGEDRSPAFLALNPAGKVPVLIHDGRVMTESMAICLYLCQLRPYVGLVPEDPQGAYAVHQRISFALTEIEPHLWLADQEQFLRIPGLPSGTGAFCLGRLQAVEPELAAWLADHDYIAGDSFTVADVLYYHLLSWASLYPLQFGGSIRRYLLRLAQRPAFPVAMAVPGSPAVTG